MEFDHLHSLPVMDFPNLCLPPAHTFITPLPTANDTPTPPQQGNSRPVLTAPPSSVTISPCLDQYVSTFRRINSLLLPIRYPPTFYSDILDDTSIADLTRVALWHDESSRLRAERSSQQRRKRKRTLSSTDVNANAGQSASSMTDLFSSPSPIPEAPPPPPPPTVVGGIRCRLEPAPPSSPTQSPQIYIQTVAVLAPYRQLSVGSALLESVLRSGIRHYGVTSIYAHVWEANEDALAWYRKRGFVVGELVTDYYRKLRPAGARLVRRWVGVQEFLDVNQAPESDVEENGPADTVEASDLVEQHAVKAVDAVEPMEAVDDAASNGAEEGLGDPGGAREMRDTGGLGDVLAPLPQLDEFGNVMAGDGEERDVHDDWKMLFQTE